MTPQSSHRSSKVGSATPAMTIAIGADHVGLALKESVKAHLKSLGHEVVDYGVSGSTPVDYTDVAVAVSRDVAAGRFARAILVCGTGIGMAMAANKVPGVRAAAASDPYSAERARKSNNAQVLCLGARVIGPSVADLLVDHWLASEFQGGDSARKVAKIDALDAAMRTPRRAAPRTPSDHLAASIMCADFRQLASQLADLRRGGVGRLHLDFGDGRFVPNLPLGVEIFGALPPRDDWARECHLMIEEPLPLIELFAPRADLLIFHLEAIGEPGQTIRTIREAGCQVGVAINPTTSAEAVFPLLNEVDEVVIMAVEPGFAGGRYVASVVDKVAAVRARIDRLGRPVPIEIDGAVGPDTIPALARAGAERFVGGTTGLFRDGDLEQHARDLIEIIERALGTPRTVPPTTRAHSIAGRSGEGRST